MVINGKDFEGAAIASLGSSHFKVTEIFLWDDGPFVSKSSQHLKSGPAKGKWKDTHSKIPRTCHKPVDEALNRVNAKKVLSTAEYDESAFTDGSLEFSQIACKDSECGEAIRDNNCSDIRQPQLDESESAAMSSEGIQFDKTYVSIKCFELEGALAFYGTFYVKRCFNDVKRNSSTWKLLLGKEHLAIGECTEPVYSEALKAAEECGTENNIVLPEQTLIGENLKGKQCDEHSAGIGVVVGSKVSDFTKHSKDQSLDHSNEYLDRNCCNSGVSCSSISNTAEHNISYNERCIPPTSKVNRAHSENKVVDGSGLDTKSEPVISKEKYKVKRRRPEKFNDETREYPATIEKYWRQRYTLFSRFDEGIKMDEEGWFSVTPEVIAQYQAKRCACGTIVDCFTGVGGNIIQFAKWSRNVIAIDIDPLKIEYARHNAAIYGVENHIKFIVGDSFLLAPTLKADTVFLSPPWGGPDYNKVKIYDLKTMLRPHDGLTLFNAAKKIAPRVVMFLPKNVDFNQLAELALSSHPPWSLEVEKVYLNGRLKAITAYFTDPFLLRRRQRS